MTRRTFKFNLDSIVKIIEVFGLIATIFSIWYSYYLSEPAKLEVNHTVDIVNKRLIISVKNKAIFKETGNISLFRLEVSDSKPNMIVKSLKPSENFTFNLGINITEKNITIPSFEERYPVLTSCKIPAGKLYFAIEESSISYKITCDNCFSQGIVRRIPDFQKIELIFIFDRFKKTCSGSLPVYSWTQVSLEELS